MFKNSFLRLLRILGIGRAAAPSAPAQEPSAVPSHKKAAAAEEITVDEKCLSFGPKATDETDAVLGLDFGTSCLRAVVRLPFVPGSLAFAVPLNDQGGPEYFLPAPSMPASSRLFGTAASNIKVRMIVDPSDEDAAARATAILAKAIRRARRWFLTTQRKNYGKFKLKWALNLGIPSSGYEDERIRLNFLRCVKAAWALSLSEATLSEECAREALTSGLGADSPVDTVPEIAAAAEGYRRSVHAKEGMHVMIDVGASTLDVCGFVVCGPTAASPFSLFTTAVEQLGAAVLHDARLRSLGGAASGAPAVAVDGRDPASRVPDDLLAYVSGGGGVPGALQIADEKFQEECQLAVRRVVCGMWQKNPLSSQWKHGTPVFLIGGGGRMKFYRRVPEVIRQQKMATVAWGKLIPEGLGEPSDLRPKGLAPEVVLRMLVAYGLSWPRPDFGAFINPASIPAMEPPPRRRLEDGYFGKEQM